MIWPNIPLIILKLGGWERGYIRGKIGRASLVEEGAYLFHDGEEFRLCLGAEHGDARLAEIRDALEKRRGG